MLSIESLLVLVLALASGLSLVSGKTAAPLLSSTLKPTSAPKTEAKPTKPLMIINAPPMKQKHLSTAPMQDGKPLQVTGFITKSGNIYEIEDKRGIGRIEPRQAEGAEEEQIVCNYGNVVIYSDVPCDQVTNVKVGEVQPLNAEPQATEAPPSENQPAEEEQQQASDTPNAPRGQQDMQQQRRRRRRRPTGASQQQRRRINGNGAGVRRRIRRRNGNGSGNRNGNGNRRVQQQQRRRQQQQQQQRRRRQQPQRRRQQVRIIRDDEEV
ncbi:uncharacterized protein Dvir_GJ15280 [Drosophila virilis]|uniref:Uncharacterized protein n=1 Tax=Drosophila virilis TaxID=7244 RepID=B4MCR2_DROVI|nr:uncharacterized protein Dvir_GJ15280 [Drosophila virilis]